MDRLMSREANQWLFVSCCHPMRRRAASGSLDSLSLLRWVTMGTGYSRFVFVKADDTSVALVSF